MRHRTTALMVAALALLAAACGFEDPTPENVRFRITGSAGTQVRALYARNFVAGVTEAGVTEVHVFSSDSVVHTLPVDTTMNIAVERRWFVQLQPVGQDTATVSVRVDVDGRSVLDESGGIFQSDPWRYVYLFNQILTRNIDVVF